MSRRNTILVVDADPVTCKMLEIVLDDTSFRVEECLTGGQAPQLCLSLKPDLLLLDIDLPDGDGHELIKALRTLSQAPIVVLTARSTAQDAVLALSLGADDYVTKPFNMNVLEARLNANLRKSPKRAAEELDLVNGPLRMDLFRHQVFMDGKPLSFTPKEYELLRYFMEHRGRALPHKELLNEIWGVAHSLDAQYLRVFVAQLREKIEITSAAPQFIVTEPGIGYRMEAKEPVFLRRRGDLRPLAEAASNSSPSVQG